MSAQMNYYTYDCVLPALRSKQEEYVSKKQHALLEIYRNLKEEQIAIPLLRRFIRTYANDTTTYLTINDISWQLQAIDIFADSAHKALGCDRINARCHYDFGRLLLTGRYEPGEFLVSYLTSINEKESCGSAILSSKMAICRAIELIEENFQSRAEGTCSPDDYIVLGNFLVFARRLDKAATAYRQAKSLDAYCAAAYSNLSFVLQLLDCQKESHIAMGESNFIQHRYSLAIECFLQALSLGEDSTDVFQKLAESYWHENKFGETAAVCAEAANKESTSKLYMLWIDALRQVNQVEQAISVAERAAADFPGMEYFQFQARLILPIIYDSEEDISKHRSRFRRVLAEWSGKYHDDAALAGRNIANDVRTTNFYLPYQGRCDVDLNKMYGRLLHRSMTAAFPQFDNPSNFHHRTTKSRIRIGYLSAFCNWHTVGKLFLGWVLHHDAERFEVYVYHLGRDVDFLSGKFESACSKFYHFSNIDIVEICSCIQSDALDVLVFLEFGMNTLVTKLAALRLAPIQCLTWGHPVTSGLPSIDYFLSSDMMEPPNGDSHYSEALVRLPNIGICVPQPLGSTSNKVRSDYGLSENRTVYVFPHSLFKQLPQHDVVFPSIAKRNRNSEFVFIECASHSIEVAHIFKARVSSAFERHDLDPDRYIRFVPAQDSQDFLRLLSVSDVYLDSIGWSGGMTTLEAISCKLPIVTMPGEFMRGRHSYGCLKRINTTETIADNVDDYVQISARLGVDEEWKEGIKLRQLSNLSKLYDDRECIVALEKFYQTLLRP